MDTGRKIILSLVLVGLLVSMCAGICLARKKGEQKSQIKSAEKKEPALSKQDVFTKKELALPLHEQLVILEEKIKEKRDQIEEQRRKFHHQERQEYREKLADPNITAEKRAKLSKEMQAARTSFWEKSRKPREELRVYSELRRKLFEEIRASAADAETKE